MKKTALIMKSLIIILLSLSPTLSWSHPIKYHHYRFKVIKQKNSPHVIGEKGVNQSYGTFNIPGTYGTMTLDQVRSGITQYGTDNTVHMPKSFFFNATDLSTYITGSKSSTLQLILTEDPGTKSLSLVLVPIDIYGQHIYLTNSTNCFLLGSLQTPPAVSAILDGTGVPEIRNFYPTALNYQTADQWRATYGGEANKKASWVSSWLFDSYEISDYIKKGTSTTLPSIKYIQFILCEVNNNLTVAIVGVDNNLKHMYFPFNTANCVLENANPCPTCEVNPTLEDCSQ